MVESAIVSIPYGAVQIREALRQNLSKTNNGLHSLHSPVEELILRYAMEQTCYVATDYEAEVKKVEASEDAVNTSVDISAFKPLKEMTTQFTVSPLSSLSSYQIDSSRFIATEGLFKPKRWGLDTKGLHQLVFDSVQQSPIDSRRTLFRFLSPFV